MNYQLAEGSCEQDVIDLITSNIRVVGFGVIGCSECPFAKPSVDVCGDDINISDPDEGHYDCGLLDKQRVWGENPDCTDRDWATWFREIMSDG